MRRRWEVIIFVLTSAVMIWLLVLLAQALNDQPTCAERGGVPTVYKGQDACLLPGGIIGGN